MPSSEESTAAAPGPAGAEGTGGVQEKDGKGEKDSGAHDAGDEDVHPRGRILIDPLRCSPDDHGPLPFELVGRPADEWIVTTPAVPSTVTSTPSPTRERATLLDDDRPGAHEERRPRRVRRVGHQHVAVTEARRGRIVDGTGGALVSTRTGRPAPDVVSRCPQLERIGRVVGEGRRERTCGHVLRVTSTASVEVGLEPGSSERRVELGLGQELDIGRVGESAGGAEQLPRPTGAASALSTEPQGSGLEILTYTQQGGSLRR